MDLRHLRYFVAVAEERHFGKAAVRLHMAQPPLSRQIQALEAELGFPLLLRSRRRVELTAAGTVLLHHARRVFETLDRAVHEAQRANAGESGRLCIGYPSSLAYTGLIDLLRAFRLRSPDVEVVLRELPPNQQIEALRDGTIDVGFVRAPIDEAELRTEHVRREPLLVALAIDHPLTVHGRIALAQIAHEPFIVFPRHRSPAFFDQIMGLCRDAGFTPHVVQEAAQLDIISFVEAGFGVAIVPASLREMHRDGVALRPIVGAPHTDLRMAWHAANPSTVLLGFVAMVREIGVRTLR